MFWQTIKRFHHWLLPPELGLGWTPYLWLFYLNFLFFPFWIGRAPSGTLLPTFVSIAVFLPLYFYGFQSRGQGTVVAVAGITAIGLLAATFNGGASVYFVYAASLAAFAGPPRRSLRYIGLIVLAAAIETWWLSLSPIFLFVTVVVAAMVGISNLYFRQIDLKNRELRASQEEIRRLATTAERERIARDLHDLLGHTLSSITLKAELAGKLIRRDPEAARAEIEEVERISRTATAEVRQAVTGYRTCSLAGELLRGQRTVEAAGALLERAVPEALRLPAELDHLLGLVLREALTNVARHAGAGRCRVSVRRDGRRVVLEVEDDGVGGRRRPRPGNGLKGMGERLADAGGELELARGDLGGLLLRASVCVDPATGVPSVVPAT